VRLEVQPDDGAHQEVTHMLKRSEDLDTLMAWLKGLGLTNLPESPLQTSDRFNDRFCKVSCFQITLGSKEIPLHLCIVDNVS
jgi:hypothetical protein